MLNTLLHYLRRPYQHLSVLFIRINYYICTYDKYFMDTKLTLKLNSSTIEQAKLYARKKNTSLSKLIETYLDLLVNPKRDEEITPLVKSLSGAITLPKGYDAKKEYKKHLTHKYSK